MGHTSLHGRGVLITGGGSGIGLASAKKLLDEGAGVVIAGRNERKLKDACSRLGRPEQISHFVADVSRPDSAESLVHWATAQLGSVDILINNAGLNTKERSLADMTPARWRELLGANLDGAFYCIHAVLPQMRSRRDGLIININSTAGKRATPLAGAAYCASKFGMHGLSHCLGIEEQKNGIRATCIYPGEVNTSILDERPELLSEEHKSRILQADDVASAVAFVAGLPPHVSIPELVIKPAIHPFG